MKDVIYSCHYIILRHTYNYAFIIIMSCNIKYYVKTKSSSLGGGGMERDQISDIRPHKKIKYQISHVRNNQITGLKQSDIRYQSPKQINYQISHPLEN